MVSSVRHPRGTTNKHPQLNTAVTNTFPNWGSPVAGKPAPAPLVTLSECDDARGRHACPPLDVLHDYYYYSYIYYINAKAVSVYLFVLQYCWTRRVRKRGSYYTSYRNWLNCTERWWNFEETDRRVVLGLPRERQTFLDSLFVSLRQFGASRASGSKTISLNSRLCSREDTNA